MADNNISGLSQSRNEKWREDARKRLTPKERVSIERVKMPELDPHYRITCNEEVNRGLTAEMAMKEASRCLDCPDPQCITGCPVSINIPKFVKYIKEFFCRYRPL